jgi:Uma2 family endonuclease
MIESIERIYIMSALPKHHWTPEEYLEFERQSDTKHEYVDGEIYDMVGGSYNHNVIGANTIRLLGNALLDGPCTVSTSDTKVRVTKTMYTYPDAAVVCGDPAFEGDRTDVLLNPILIVEVLSPSTEKYDRGDKFQSYRSLASLESYLLIAQDTPHVEHWARQGDQWVFSEAKGLETEIEIASLGVRLALAGIYHRVVFETGQSQE